MKLSSSEQRKASTEFTRSLVVTQQALTVTVEVLNIQIQAEAAEKSHRRIGQIELYAPVICASARLSRCR